MYVCNVRIAKEGEGSFLPIYYHGSYKYEFNYTMTTLFVC